MKCPKCGSEEREYQCLNEKCEAGKLNIDVINSNVAYAKKLYQQRLDKVLSKFVIIGGGEWIYEMMDYVNILYDGSTFYFQAKYELSSPISLKTVESILEDLDNE